MKKHLLLLALGLLGNSVNGANRPTTSQVMAKYKEAVRAALRRIKEEFTAKVGKQAADLYIDSYKKSIENVTDKTKAQLIRVDRLNSEGKISRDSAQELADLAIDHEAYLRMKKISFGKSLKVFIGKRMPPFLLRDYAAFEVKEVGYFYNFRLKELRKRVLVVTQKGGTAKDELAAIDALEAIKKDFNKLKKEQSKDKLEVISLSQTTIDTIENLYK